MKLEINKCRAFTIVIVTVVSLLIPIVSHSETIAKNENTSYSESVILNEDDFDWDPNNVDFFGELDQFEENGITYQIWLNNQDKREVFVYDISEDLGTEVIIPERVYSTEYDREFEVIAFSLFCDKESLRRVRKLYIPQTFRKMFKWRNCSSTSYYYNYLSRDTMKWFENMEYYEVDPNNQYFESVNGILYEKDDCKNNLYLYSIPQKYNCNGMIEIDPRTGHVCWEAIYNVENLQKLHFLGAGTIDFSKGYKELKYKSSISDNLNLEEIIFEGNVIGDCSYNIITGCPNLSSIIFGENVTSLPITIPAETSSFYSDVQKLKIPENLEIYDGLSCSAMHVWLPNVRKISIYGGRSPQSYYIGDKIEEIDIEWLIDDYSWRKYDPIVCCMSPVPPKMTQRFEWSKSSYRLNTLYVPESYIQAYKDDTYWGRTRNILPVTDKLIPFVSYPVLLLEEGWNYKYQWDVMALGNAKPCETGVWESDNPEVVSIDQDGRAEAHSPGTANITFTLCDTDGNAYTAVSKVHVSETGSADEITEDSTFSEDTFRSSIPDGVYNMNGQRISESTEGVPGGIYIIRKNGRSIKKVILK